MSIKKRISKNEYRRKVFYRFLLNKKTEYSDSILRYSAVRYSIFCGSLFSPVAKAASLIIKEQCHFGEVSHISRIQRPGAAIQTPETYLNSHQRRFLST